MEAVFEKIDGEKVVMSNQVVAEIILTVIIDAGKEMKKIDLKGYQLDQFYKWIKDREKQ